MNNINKEQLNSFLVSTFNRILAWEDRTFKDMKIKDLTLREFHVIEAVYHLKSTGDNKMSSIAKFLSITPGSLTTSVDTLVSKGYLMRKASENDRRVIVLVPTKKADMVNEKHKKIHMELIDELLRGIDQSHADVFLDTLNRLDLYFADECNMRK